jgi:hypothetical protein
MTQTLLWTERDAKVLRWVGEQYAVRGDLLAHLLRREGQDEADEPLGPRSTRRVVQRWRQAGLVQAEPFFRDRPAMVWLTYTGMASAGLSYRPTAPSLATVAHRHAVGVVRAAVEAAGEVEWLPERELREGKRGRDAALPDGVVLAGGRRTAIEVELTPKTLARTLEVIRTLLAEYDDVVYFATPSAARVVERAVERLKAGDRVRVRAYPPNAFAALK